MIRSVNHFFSNEQEENIKQAILNAELDTSGEIRVHLELECNGDVMDRAATLFEKLDMHETELRNGVLFYLAVKNRKFAILGDAGINNVVPENFWDKIKFHMLEYFRQDHFTEGLIEGIGLTGVQLKEHFPHMADDVNELPDDISYGQH